MVVAKTIPAQTHLVEALQARQITREYEAIAIGHMTAGGVVDAPIGRHPTQRTHMAVVPNGRESVTHYRVHEKFRGHTRLRLRLETGRTTRSVSTWPTSSIRWWGSRLRRSSASAAQRHPRTDRGPARFPPSGAARHHAEAGAPHHG